MDFITELKNFLDRKPMNAKLKEEIIQHATNLRKTEAISNLTIETAVDNIIEMFKKYPDAESKMMRDYLTYILNKVKEAK